MILLEWLEILFATCVCASLLMLWLDTNVVFEYLNYFRLGGRLIYQYREKRKEKFFNLNLAGYLVLEHNCFFTRLIGCAICLNFWFNLIINLLFFHWHHIPITFIFSLCVYYYLIKLKGEIENARI